jgi:hypothetical protein
MLVNKKRLIVTRLPERKSWYLCIEDGAVISALARFIRGEESVDRLMKFMEEERRG